MQRPLACLLVLAVALSGCSGKDDKDGPTPTTMSSQSHQTVTLDVKMDRPEWQRGQVWTYRVEIPGLPTSTFKMMVAEDGGDLWIVATDDRAKALNHALYSTNPVLGRITKQSLSPYQSGKPVTMYEFPLSDRKSWSSQFFGEAMQFSATYSDTIEALPKTYLPGFNVVAQGAKQARVLFNYVEGVEWFTDFQVYDGNGTKQIHLILTSYGANYQGGYHFLRGTDQFQQVFTASTNLSPPTTFDVQEDFHKLGLGLIVENTGDQVAVVNATLKNPGSSPVYSRQFTLARDQQELEILEVPPDKGAWTVELTVIGNARIDLRTVGLVVFEGSL